MSETEIVDFDFYEINGYEKHHPRWFISEDRKLHYFFGDATAYAYEARYDGELHFSENETVLSIVSLGEGYCQINFDDNSAYRILEEGRVVGLIPFFHWRHGLYEHHGLEKLTEQS